jgi:pyruvate dehydrogenase E1 component beta subunit
MPKILYRDALNQALREEMRRDENVFLMGEEVGFYQGAFKISRNLLEEFGEKRVVDTPITEPAFTGVGIGAAMVGLRPVVEMMTLNFAILALDQIINNASKIRYMSGGQFSVPLVIRGPGGAAHQLAAQHSQTLDSYFCHIPGLKVIVPATPGDAKGLLKSAIRDDNPVVFIEGELLYGVKGEVPEGEYLIPIGVADRKRKGTDVTIITWSKMFYLASNVAKRLEDENISAELIDLRTLRPLDEDSIFESVKKTGRAVIVEENWPYCGVGAEIAYQIQKNAFEYLDAPVERVASLDVPMPYAKNLEAAVLPTEERVIDAVKRVMYLS